MNKKHELERAESDLELFIKYRNGKDLAVRNEIVSRYLYLAEILSKKFLNRGVDYNDIFQVACVALINAVERFDTAAEVKFVSFATPTIIGEIKRYFRDKASVIRVPRRLYEVYQKVNLAKEHLTQKNGRSPKVEEIADYIDITEESVLEIIESWNVYKIQSFDQTIYEEDDLELYETIGEDDQTFERIINRDFIEKSLEHFDKTEKEFIHLRFFENKTQKQIAEHFNVSQMYISRMEKKTLEKFRKILRR